jgi:RNA polymerase sigma factor (sigma-70 family)
MHSSKVNGELGQSEFEAARLGFIKYLRRKRFSPQFIDNHGDDLFATATLEYSRKLTEGAEIERPSGWLIDCAWKRTKSLLEARQRRPRLVSAAKTEEVLADDDTPTPEDVVLEEDRFRKVHEAVAQLSEDDRRFLAHAYFEEIPVREVARQLGWHPSKAQRYHEAARRRLHELLGVRSADDLEVEIGLAAYLSLTAEASTGARVPGISGLLERAVEKSAEGLASLKQAATTTYYRAVDPTPLAAARPGTVATVVAGCIALGGGATYCVEQGMNPVGAARGLIASTAEPEASPPSEPLEPAAQAPIYTPVEPVEDKEQAPLDPAPAPEEKPERQPKSEPQPVKDNFAPVRTDYMAAAKTEDAESYEEAPEEPAPVETSSPEPAPVAGTAPQFGRPGGSSP